MRDVYMIGAYTTVFKKHPGLSFGDLAREAYLGTLKDAGMDKGTDIETGWLGNCGMGFWGQNSIRGQALFQPLVEEGLFPARVPMFNVENACATASTAFMGAWKDVLAGTHELTFCPASRSCSARRRPSARRGSSTRATSPASTTGWSRR